MRLFSPNIISQILTNPNAFGDLSKATLHPAANGQKPMLWSSTSPATTKLFLSSHLEVTDCLSGSSALQKTNSHWWSKVGKARGVPACVLIILAISKLQLHRLLTQPLTWAPHSHLSEKNPPDWRDVADSVRTCCQIQETILSVQGNK